MQNISKDGVLNNPNSFFQSIETNYPNITLPTINFTNRKLFLFKFKNFLEKEFSNTKFNELQKFLVENLVNETKLDLNESNLIKILAKNIEYLLNLGPDLRRLKFKAPIKNKELVTQLKYLLENGLKA